MIGVIQTPVSRWGISGASLLAVGCVMPLSKPCGASRAAAPKVLEYSNNLNRRLTCNVVGPVLLSTIKRYTTRSAPWLKIFV